MSFNSFDDKDNDGNSFDDNDGLDFTNGVFGNLDNNLNQAETLSNQDPQEAAPEVRSQDPPYFNQQNNIGHDNQEIPMTSTFNRNNPFHSGFQSQNVFSENTASVHIPAGVFDSQNMKSAPDIPSVDVSKALEQVKDVFQNILKRPSYALSVVEGPFEEEKIEKKFIQQNQDPENFGQRVSIPQIQEELNPMQSSTMPENLSANLDTNNKLPEIANPSDSIQIKIQESKDRLKICFRIKLEGKKLELKSHKNKKDPFDNWKALKKVKKLVLDFRFLIVNQLARDLRLFVDELDQLEEISLDFRYLEDDSSRKNKYEQKLAEILPISFQDQTSLETIKLYWKEPEGAQIVVQNIVKQLRCTMSSLKHLILNLENTQLPYASFKDIIAHIQGNQENFEALRLFVDVESPEEARIAQRKLEMPNIKEFALNLTCLGPFSADIIQFVTESISTMKNITSLELKLIFTDYTGEIPTETLIRDLFKGIKEVISKLQVLKVIISLEKKDEPQDDNANFERLIQLVVQCLDPYRMKDFTIGIKPTAFKRIEKKKNIKKFWNEEMKKIQEQE